MSCQERSLNWSCCKWSVANLCLCTLVIVVCESGGYAVCWLCVKWWMRAGLAAVYILSSGLVCKQMSSSPLWCHGCHCGRWTDWRGRREGRVVGEAHGCRTREDELILSAPRWWVRHGGGRGVVVGMVENKWLGLEHVWWRGAGRLGGHEDGAARREVGWCCGKAWWHHSWHWWKSDPWHDAHPSAIAHQFTHD